MKVYVINLERRKDRLEKFLKYNDQYVKDLNIFKAIDGNDINDSVIEQLREHNLIEGPLGKMNKYIIGNALSQRELWHLCTKLNDTIIICEDDAVLRKDFEEKSNNFIKLLDNDWDIIYFGYNLDTVLNFDFLPGVEKCICSFGQTFYDDNKLDHFQNLIQPIYPFHVNRCYGVPCYAISPKGAKKLLEICFPLKEIHHPLPELNRTVTTYTLDIIIMHNISKINAYISFPPLAITPNDKSLSNCTPFG